MFHINEADEGKGTLTVTDDGMTVHIRLASKKITELYAGTVEQAKADIISGKIKVWNVVDQGYPDYLK